MNGIILLTDRRQTARPLPEVVAAAVAGGLRQVVLRERDLPRAQRAALADRLRGILAPVGGTLIVAGPDPLGGDAVHLRAAGPYPPPVFGLVGRSCHDETELGRLTTEDYVTVSPVFATASKPGYGPPLGPAGLARLVRVAAGRPVVALAGVTTAEQVAACRAAGAVGAAVMGAVMRAADPAAVAAELVAAASPAEVSS
ncbi:thiamine phosphate synthase [Solwaraspora sp. WMMA2080]|uniref:thiamine phosphate synthase n=1 Tax=unclassified Solwaraspora TaxID=2627926 RepID=UPI00248ABDCF|nr:MULTISPECIES: thiamine phosphate synthase [unclassified Solwaraspora]WBB96319.1 thiamine phosphate synthase [Solwaraspora sp. WMMA2059]WBC19778.1 thiamine phosphate synthase [Solwaraspora sp. WMMA2080]